MRVLVTGANGFLGSEIVRCLSEDEGKDVFGSVRHFDHGSCRDRLIQVASLSKETDWSTALVGVKVVIHTAARVHVMQDRSRDPLQEYRRTNVEGTLELARQSALAGVQRFIFVSSIKVNGEGTSLGQPFTADDAPLPCDPYGQSKFEAEVGLREICASSGMEFVIIRPPLIYGPKVGANFASLVRWVGKGLPLPLKGVKNLRSFVFIENLVSLIEVCLKHPSARNQVFLVSDGRDIATPDLLRAMAAAFGGAAKLINIPPVFLVFFATMLGKKAAAGRLCGSLQVNIDKTKSLLGWIPPFPLEVGLEKTIRGLSEKSF